MLGNPGRGGMHRRTLLTHLVWLDTSNVGWHALLQRDYKIVAALLDFEASGGGTFLGVLT